MIPIYYSATCTDAVDCIYKFWDNRKFTQEKRTNLKIKTNFIHQRNYKSFFKPLNEQQKNGLNLIQDIVIRTEPEDLDPSVSNPEPDGPEYTSAERLIKQLISRDNSGFKEFYNEIQLGKRRFDIMTGTAINGRTLPRNLDANTFEEYLIKLIKLLPPELKKLALSIPSDKYLKKIKN